jgi:hypothetical protein
MRILCRKQQSGNSKAETALKPRNPPVLQHYPANPTQLLQNHVKIFIENQSIANEPLKITPPFLVC